MLFKTIMILTLVSAGLASVSAATFTVNSTVDSHDAAAGNGVCADSLGRCTLRAALEETNALAGADTLTVPAGTYTQAPIGGTQTPPIINGPLTLNGAGSATTIIQPSSSGPAFGLDVLEINTSASVVINGVTLRNGGSGGLNVLTTTSVTINNCVIRDNQKTGIPFSVYGAAVNIWGGSLVLNNTLIVNNKLISAYHGSAGGGIYARNTTVTLNNSVVSNNRIENSGSNGSPMHGAGIALEGSFSFNATNSQITNNSTSTSTSNSLRGAGISALATGGASVFNLTSTKVSGNYVSGGYGTLGAGIYLETTGTGTITSTIDRSTVSGNQVTDYNAFGGGMFIGIYGGAVNQTMTNSTVSGNYSGAYGGGILITNSGSNAATGTGTFNYTNDTISANQSGQDGGGIYFYKWNSLANPFVMNLNFVTIANNGANLDNVGTNGGGGIMNTGTVNLKNSVIATNYVLGGAYGFDLRGVFYSQGYNHIAVADLFTLYNSTATDGWGTVALGPLQNNSGPTYTHLPNFGPLVDQIPYGVNGCGTTVNSDQRGLGRPAYSKCDKGAVEWWYAN